MTQIVVSVSAPALDALQLQNIIATPGYPVRVLACEQVAGDDRNPIYAYVTANEDGDYLVSKIKLTRTGLASNQYRATSKIMAVDGTYQTLYHALQIVDAQRTGKFRSLSGPPPLSSAMFSLNELGLEPSPLLDSILADWMATQDIAPLRYAVYNPQRNEIEVSFQDPSAHNDEEHQLRIKEAIGKQLRELFESRHAVADETQPSGRYTRRPINNRTHNMSIITINLGGDDVSSESAAKPAKYTFARVSGQATMVLPSSARAGLTEIKTHLKRAKSDRTKALRLVASHASVLKQVGTASTKERRTALKAKAKTIKGQVSALNKSAKAALSAANKSARSHGLGGLTLPISTDILASAKKLAAAKTDTFGATGKRGKFKPRFTPDAKFAQLTGKSLHPMTGPKTAAKKAANSIRVAEKMGLTGKAKAPTVKPTKQRAGEKRANGTLKPKKVAAKKSDAATAAAIDKALPGILAKVGFKFNAKRSAGLIRNAKGGKVMKSNDNIAKMRDALAKKFDVQDTDDGFEIPGLLEVKTGPTGVVIVRPDRYVKENDPAVRVRSTSAPYARPKAAIKVDGPMRSALNRLVHDKIKGGLTKQWHYRMYANKITFINASTHKSFTLSADDLKSDGITSREAAAVAREIGVTSA
ncbi:hypothetical protein pEaSNUABM5_00199 [Erwinia phage pEa_SNUABM_5]|uniref:Uncharacterized protein n=1 Tax=Erwinia phage pEa_SNUABM_5 TaxID=2797313 RepID=A0A7T8EPK7_9CAUD|nr:hypothetical protein MPK73_gp199 [Erwinia phage pEa_SNUABM_5]QQO90341.1 hypothetical protein pEaSNUABM5_00199 [Erwinia phage pEa_SNUABM_5]